MRPHGHRFVLPRALLLAALAASPSSVDAVTSDGPELRGPIAGPPTTPVVLEADLRQLPAASGATRSRPPSDRPRPRVIEPVKPEVLDTDVRRLPPAERWQPGDPVREMPDLREYPDPPERPPGVGPGDPWTAVALFEGLVGEVAGPSGAVGAQHYVQAVGGQVAVYDKTGALLAGPVALLALWQAAGASCGASGAGETAVRYDPLAGRWLLVRFATGGPEACIAVSRGGDPISGGWYLYRFALPTALGEASLAVWPDGYYVCRVGPTGLVALAFDRRSLLAGRIATTIHFELGPGGSAAAMTRVLPAGLEGPPPPDRSPAWLVHEVVEAGDAGSAGLEILGFGADFAKPESSRLTTVGTIPLGSGRFHRPIEELFEPVYRNLGGHEALAIAGTTAAEDRPSGRDLRWHELRRRPGGAWFVYQHGTLSPEGALTGRGSVSTDGRGGLLLSYPASTPDGRSTFEAAGRLDSDPPGTLPRAAIVVARGAGSDPETGGRRARVRSSVDPADDCTVWLTGAAGAGSSVIAALRPPSCRRESP